MKTSCEFCSPRNSILDLGQYHEVCAGMGSRVGYRSFQRSRAVLMIKNGLTGLQKGVKAARVPSHELAAVAMVPCSNEHL